MGNALPEDILAALRDEIRHLSRRDCYHEAFRCWYERTDTALTAVFGPSSAPVENFRTILFTPLFLTCRCDDTLFAEAYEKGLQEADSLLGICLERLSNKPQGL